MDDEELTFLLSSSSFNDKTETLFLKSFSEFS